MMWRPVDPAHPAYDPSTRRAVPVTSSKTCTSRSTRSWARRCDRMRPDTTLVVMSDHGFASWRRSFHLNSWLRDHGYLAVRRSRAWRRIPGTSERRLVAHACVRAGTERPVHQSARPRADGASSPRRSATLWSTEIRERCFARSIRRPGRPAVTKAYPREASTGRGHADRRARHRRRLCGRHASVERIRARGLPAGVHRWTTPANGAATTAWIRTPCRESF